VKRALATIAAASSLLSAASARADDSTAARRAAAAREMDRPYTMAELSTGFLALPAANVCIRSLTDCDRGEFSLAVGLHNLYRYHNFGLGAGILWATTVRNDVARGAPAIEREHARRYFVVEVQGRYYFVRRTSWDVWTGINVGGVIVNDSWTAKADREPYADTAFIGPRATTLGTEGFSIGLGIGVEWSFARNWSFGTGLRYSNWFLPGERKVSPTLDVASLSGRQDTFDVGLRFAYRIAL
jgi:hypothetical protein